MSIRVLYITGETVPGNNGGSVHVWEVASNLSRLGYNVTLISQKQGTLAHSEYLKGVKLLRPNMQYLNKILPIAGLKLLPKLLMRKFDIIIERYVTFGGVGTIYSKLKKIPLILEVNSPHTEELIWRYNITSRAIVNMLRSWRNVQFAQAKKVIATSLTVVPEHARLKTEQVRWAANTDMFRPELINTEKADSLRKTYNLGNKFTVVFAGTFRKWHGALDLPEIVKTVISKDKNVQFLFVGGGECLDEVKAKIASLDLSQYVIFVGEQKYEMMPYFMAISDVGIAPYNAAYYKPLKDFGFFWSPLKIFEYMASGLPVITVSYDPLPEIVINGETGFITPAEEPSKTAEAILDLAKNPLNASHIGKKAREFVKNNYTWKLHVDNLDRIIKTTLEKINNF
ncbi:glycosyltransferase family 4 protein [bacterium]|nr:glycosyltransferase family 4 protein [bacterium]